MPILSLQDVRKEYSGTVVLDGVSIDLNEGDKAGLIGANGAGKTTVLRIAAGLLEPDGGTVVRARGLDLAYLSQRPDIKPGHTVREEALRAFDHVRAYEERMRAVEREMESLAAGPELDAAVRRHARLHEMFEHHGGYEFESRVDKVLVGLGFDEKAAEKSASVLSGGEKNRLALARLLLEGAECLLLDEPTNYLDLDAIAWLEEFLAAYDGTFVVVSHDRYFLDRVTTRILEISRGAAASFRGNYSDYLVQKELRDESLRRAAEQQRKEIAKQEEYIRRNLAGQNTRQAKGRRRRLERLERLEGPAREEAVRFKFAAVQKGGDRVLEAAGLSVAFGERRLFEGLSLELVRGEALGVIGPNGCGKSTLLKALAGRRPSDAGQVKLGATTAIAYFDQEHSDLPRERTVVDFVHDLVPQLTDVQVRSFLGALSFRDDEVDKTIGSLSGGETSRVAIAELVLSKANVLLLDEPTNHLDLPTRGVLEEALEDYPGTIVVVSHDRYLLDRIADRILLLGPGGPRIFPGNFSDFAARMRADSSAEKAPSAKATTARPKAEPRKKLKPSPRKRSLEAVERDIIVREEAIAKLHEELAREENWRDAEKQRRVKDDLARLMAELAALNYEWESFSES